MTATTSTMKLSLSTGACDTSSDTDSIKSSSADSDSDSLDSDDIDLDRMSTSQFLYLPKEDLLQLDPILSDDDEDSDPTPTSSTHLSLSVSTISPRPLEQSVPTITIITPETEISYARDSYSPSAITHLLPPHLTEAQFVTVLQGDALAVIQELTDYLWIVRVCRTDAVGIIPAWNVEGELERVARLNMEVNGRVSSPVTSPQGSPSSSEGSSSEGSTPTTPSSTSDEPSSFLEDSVYVADQSYYRPTKARRVQGVKSVGFVSAKPQVVFRYPSETYIHGQWDDSVKVEDRIATSAIWSHGWLESDEDSPIEDNIMDPEASTGMKRKTRRGRKRDRRWMPNS